MRKLLLALAPVIVALGLVLPASPASAHQYDTNSYFYCGAHRIENGIIIHSVPIYLDTSTVIYACKEQRSGYPSYTFDVWVSLVDGSSTGTHYQNCNVACQDVP